jgi:hypothetical protein
MYEESLGAARQQLEKELRAFDDVLDTQDERKIRDFSVSLKDKLDQFEKERNLQ